MNAFLKNALASVMPTAVATGLFSSLCTIQQPSGILDSGGAPDGTWNDVDGLVDIPCMAPPSGFGARIQATEAKSVQDTLRLNTSHILLNAYYPQIVAWWRAVVDDAVFDIMGVENDSQKQMTRLEVRIATI